MSEWPKDWPEDKKIGPGFLSELMRRYPGKVRIGSLDEAEQWLDEEQKTDKKTKG